MAGRPTPHRRITRDFSIRRKALCLLLGLAAAFSIYGCGDLSASDLPTPLPAEYLPTVIALTLQAGQSPTPALPATLEPGELQTAQPAGSAPAATPADGSTLRPATSPASPPERTETPPGSTQTPEAGKRTPSIATTPISEIPEAAIQIYRPGDRSRVASPLHVSAYLRPGAVGQARIELLGEDGRVLVRQIKTFTTNRSAWANLTLDLNFEISAAAEMGRLLIAVVDDFDRLIALNSVDLILLSLGDADINPSSAIEERIILQQPQSKALIQGGTVVVSGLARPDTEQALVAQLVDEKNRVVGMRLVKVELPPDGGYGAFLAEVPYTVGTLTPVRLMIYEGGDTISEMRHLSSVEISVSP